MRKRDDLSMYMTQSVYKIFLNFKAGVESLYIGWETQKNDKDQTIDKEVFNYFYEILSLLKILPSQYLNIRLKLLKHIKN